MLEIKYFDEEIPNFSLKKYEQFSNLNSLGHKTIKSNKNQPLHFVYKQKQAMSQHAKKVFRYAHPLSNNFFVLVSNIYM